MKTILITGASGQLGQCLKVLSEGFPNFKFVFKNSKELDVTNPEDLKATFSSLNIDWCINCAAYTAVDLAEDEPDIANKINSKAVKELAKVCEKNNTTLIHVSTDFVFDGEKTEPYRETDNTNPINTYGQTKNDGEKEIIKELSRFFIIRTSWLYSEFANNFMKTMLRISESRKELNVVNDQVGTPTYAIDLAKAILSIIYNNQTNYGVYHYSNEGFTTWFGFAKEIFNISNRNVSINPVTSQEFVTKATRPKYSVLDKTKIKTQLHIEVPNWKSSLKTALNNYAMKENLKIAINAALKAGEVIMEVYNNPINVELKDDKSPLTEADTKANTVINQFLQPTNIPIISEENKQIDYNERKDWKSCWVVDPVDGTKEFIKRNGEFTVNIALIENGKPQLGVIYVPVERTVYFANVNTKEAFKSKLPSHNCSIEQVYELSEKLLPKINTTKSIQVVGSRSHMNDETLNYVEQLKSQGKDVEIVSKGSSLKFCLVAEGNADVYPRFAPTMEWDTAAGQAICNAVGIDVISKATNKSLKYNKENLLNPWFLVTNQ